MAIESIRLFDPLPSGRYKFVVEGTPEKFQSGKSFFRKWKLIVEYAGEIRKIRLSMFASAYQDIVLACGIGTLQGKNLDWNDEDADGCCFFADLIYSKEVKGTFSRLRNVRSIEEEDEYEKAGGI